jgi:hypothetical protein
MHNTNLHPLKEKAKETKKWKTITLLHQKQEHFHPQGQYFHLEEQQPSVWNYSI